jgi:DNA-binding transcriptional LysR family regulator
MAMEGSADEVRAILESGAIDLGMLQNRRIPTGWYRVEVGQDETCSACRKGIPMPRRKALAKDLNGLRTVVFDSSFLQRRVLDQLCRKAGVQFRLVLQSNFVPLIHEAVADGLGAATLLRSTVEQDSRLLPTLVQASRNGSFQSMLASAHSLSKANARFVDAALGRHQRAREGVSRKS